MKQQSTFKVFVTFLWRAILLAFTFSLGLVISRILLYRSGVVPPRMPQQAPESIAVYYLFTGSFILALGLLPITQKIASTFLSRFLIVFFFLFSCFGISGSLESSIYSIVEGYHLMVLVLFLPILLFSIVSALLTNSPTVQEPFSKKTKKFFEQRILTQWVWRFALSIFSFPVIYFIFGIIVSPFVKGYYHESTFGLTIPGLGTIVTVQFIRSILFLFVTLPIIISWTGKVIELVLFLGLAHFVIVFSYDIVLAYQLPLSLVLIHGVEILLDSVIYSWVIVRLLVFKVSK